MTRAVKLHRPMERTIWLSGDADMRGAAMLPGDYAKVNCRHKIQANACRETLSNFNIPVLLCRYDATPPSEDRLGHPYTGSIRFGTRANEARHHAGRLFLVSICQRSAILPGWGFHRLRTDNGGLEKEPARLLHLAGSGRRVSLAAKIECRRIQLSCAALEPGRQDFSNSLHANIRLFKQRTSQSADLFATYDWRRRGSRSHEIE